MNTCTAVLPIICGYRVMIIMGRVGVTSIGSYPYCSAAGVFMSPVDVSARERADECATFPSPLTHRTRAPHTQFVYLLTFGSLLFCLAPTAKGRKVKPTGSTVETTVGSTVE